MKTRFVVSLLALTANCSAAVTLHPLFSDRMVLQREMPVSVWGKADPGEKVQVRFAGQVVDATADADGKWTAQLAPMPASAESREIVVAGSNTITLQDVVVGDVWLASGQSNMDSPLRSGSTAPEVAEAKDPLIRFFNVKKAVAAEPLLAPEGKWVVSSPAVSPDFSAIGYLFAKEIRKTQGVPVGIIRSAWGGTPIVAWMSMDALRQDPPVARALREWDTAFAKYTATKDQPELMEAYYRDMKDWETNVQAPHKAALKTHKSEIAAAKTAGNPPPPAPQLARPEPEMPNPIAMPSASKRPQVPSITYNAMITSLAPYGLKGVLWYQGEGDTGRTPEYRVCLPRLIENWRSLFKQARLPFMIVQLPGFGANSSLVVQKGIPFLRSAQQAALSLPATGMAVTADIGEAAEAHPDNKRHVAARLALAARETAYGEKVNGSSPYYDGHEVRDGAVVVRFKNAAGGLIISEPPWRPASAPAVPTDRLLGFCVKGATGDWVSADARIEGETVVVSSPSVKEPIAVAYGWTETPVLNLYSREGLPAAPFRTDEN
jgi:sialate O-acetylesterase